MTQAMDIDSREASPEFPFRPLNVRDALTYMELVKVDYPEVYTQFLDIMKEFKLQAYVITVFSQSSVNERD